MTLPSPASDDQSAVMAFLSRPESYGLHGGVVQRIDTHCSVVFLAGDRAYKLKRSLRYSSLDYTTRALRKDACDAELVLNRRTAPALYLSVQSINRDTLGGLAFDGPGASLDHVVVMRRFAQSDLFDRMLDDGRLTPSLMRSLGEAVARLHLTAQPTPRFGGCDAIRDAIANNDRELARVAEELDGAAVATLGSETRAMLDGIAGLLDRRRTDGKVRRCHGDLRLANICLYDGAPTLFDCIEFSDEIGCIDVLYDLAFLLMDLTLSGRGDLGNAVFNAYLDLAPETEGLRALPLFLALRSATRSYALAGSAHRRADPAQAAERLALARRHIDAGLTFLAPHPPLLLVLGGDADRVRREMAALLAARTLPAPGARLLHHGPNEAMVWAEAGGVLAAGCSALVEGRFADPAEQGAAVALASRLAVQRIGFWLGSLPADLDPRLWQELQTSDGPSAAVARAEPLVSTIAGTLRFPIVPPT